MARNIKGITIDIGGNTTKLQDALKGVNKTIYATNSELKALNQALKLDPKNTELLSQKQEVLAKNVAATSQKLKELKDAQAKMGDYSKLTDEQKESYRTLTIEITKTEAALKGMTDEMQKASSSKFDMKGVQDGLSKVKDMAIAASKAIAGAVVAAGVAIGKVVADGVKSYAQYEQNVGGVETLFKESSDKVIENAKKAYKTAGVSANEYMAGITSFSASLLQSVAGDTNKAADIADQAFRDMSDNANKFGTDMGSIQNAYQGFAKQNYTMLDNLKLGYGGTKTEMERLLKDAQAITGVKYDISNLSDVYNAIHVIQGELDITGTTAKEANETISGSAAAMKASWDNFLNGSGNVEDLGKSITTFLNNVLKAIKKLAPDIIKGLLGLFKEIGPTLAGMANELLPMVIEGAQELIQGLINWISNDSEDFVNMAVNMLTNIVNFILQNLPLLLEASIKIIAQLASGIAQAMPDLIPAIVDCIILMVETLIDNLDLLVDAAIELILALVEGIMRALPRLIEKAPEIVIKLVQAIIKAAPKILEGAAELIGKLVEGLINGIGKIAEVGWQLIEGLLNGIREGWENLKKGASDVGNAIVDWFKGIFGIHSPSRVFRDEIGKNLGLGLVEGIEDTESMVNAAMSDLASGINASVNPTINPTANTNPLIIQIENFNNTRESDIEQLAQELEFYRKNSALAKGGNTIYE